MAYSKRKAVMFDELCKKFDIEEVAEAFEISVESVKRAIRYGRKVCLK